MIGCCHRLFTVLQVQPVRFADVGDFFPQLFNSFLDRSRHKERLTSAARPGKACRTRSDRHTRRSSHPELGGALHLNLKEFEKSPKERFCWPWFWDSRAALSGLIILQLIYFTWMVLPSGSSVPLMRTFWPSYFFTRSWRSTSYDVPPVSCNTYLLPDFIMVPAKIWP